MSQAIVQHLKGPYDRTLGMLEQYLEVCPDAVWTKTFAAWPVWRQWYHVFASLDFFTRQEGGADTPAPLAPEAGNLSAEYTGPALTKEQAKAYLAAAKKTGDAYFAGLTDATLTDRNEGLSARLNTELSHAVTASMLSGHASYHLGCCDAALREAGLKGVF